MSTLSIIKQAIINQASELGVNIGDTVNLTTLLDSEVIASGFTFNVFGELCNKKNVLYGNNTLSEPVLIRDVILYAPSTASTSDDMKILIVVSKMKKDGTFSNKLEYGAKINL